jgi:hypothetical protein
LVAQCGYRNTRREGIITPSGAKNENAVLQHVNPHPMVPGVAYRKVAAFDPFVIDSCGGISSSFCTVISLA